MFTVDTGRMHQETYDLMDAVRERYGMTVEVYATRAPRGEAAWRGTRRRTCSTSSVPLRLLCCQVRKVRPLQRVLDGPRRVDHRAAARPVGQPVEHPQDRDRPRPRRDREDQSAGRLDARRGVGLHPGARRAVARRCTRRATPASAARPAPGQARPARTPRRAAGGGRRTRPRSAGCTAPSRRAASSTSGGAA